MDRAGHKLFEYCSVQLRERMFDFLSFDPKDRVSASITDGPLMEEIKRIFFIRQILLSL